MMLRRGIRSTCRNKVSGKSESNEVVRLCEEQRSDAGSNLNCSGWFFFKAANPECHNRAQLRVDMPFLG